MGKAAGSLVEVGTLGLVKGEDVLGDPNAAADATRQAAATQAQAQMAALEYLKETEALPQQIREQALTQLQGAYGLGDPGAQQQMIAQAQQSPLYGAIMGTQQAGEEAILRQAGATGGLRSGNVQQALADNAQQLQQQALLQSYGQQLQGLQGLAQLPSQSQQIAGMMGDIGRTQAQGISGAAQAQLAGEQAQTNTVIGGLAGLGQLFSDSRLKKNIKKIGQMAGFNLYEWDWNDLAADVGLSGSSQGFIAQEVQKVRPDAIGEREGYLTVNYGALV